MRAWKPIVLSVALLATVVGGAAAQWRTPPAQGYPVWKTRRVILPGTGVYTIRDSLLAPNGYRFNYVHATAFNKNAIGGNDIWASLMFIADADSAYSYRAASRSTAQQLLFGASGSSSKIYIQCPQLTTATDSYPGNLEWYGACEKIYIIEDIAETKVVVDIQAYCLPTGNSNDGASGSTFTSPEAP